jgi:hypothetical protein
VAADWMVVACFRLQQIKQLEPFFVRSSLGVSEPLLQVSFRFGDIYFVNACHVCCLNPTDTFIPSVAQTEELV